MTDEEIVIQLTKHSQEIGSLKRRMNDAERMNETIKNMSASTEKLAISMENMLKEQKKQGERLDILEKIPSDRYNAVLKTAVTAIISAIAGALAVGLLNLISIYI